MSALVIVGIIAAIGVVAALYFQAQAAQAQAALAAQQRGGLGNLLGTVLPLLGLV